MLTEPKITSIAGLKRAVELEFGNRWVYPFEYKGEKPDTLHKSVISKISEFEASARARLEQFEREEREIAERGMTPFVSLKWRILELRWVLGGGGRE